MKRALWFVYGFLAGLGAGWWGAVLWEHRTDFDDQDRVH